MDKHGIYISEAPTSIFPPVTVNTAIPVFFTTAPVHLAKNPAAVANVPKLCTSYAEAASYFGMSTRKEIWNNYTSCQVVYSQFALYGVAPAVIVNVLDPEVHKRSVSGEEYRFEGYSLTIPVDGVLISTVKISDSVAGPYSEGTHYNLSFNNDGYVVVNAKKNAGGGIAENAVATLAYDVLAPEMVDEYDIIGGYDTSSGNNKGLELMNEIYSTLSVIPGLIVAPKFSSVPSVAAIMETKAGNINGHFKCMAIVDIPTEVDGRKLLYADVPAWKNTNGYTSARQINCYPKLKMDGLDFYYSTQLAGLIGITDYENGGMPYVSPSNKLLKANGMAFEDGSEMVLNSEQAAYLDSNGVVTATNFTKGWVSWGNNTGAYPGNTDVKDRFISVRRMFNWVGNTIITTYWNRVDFPITQRLIKTITDSIGMWFNGLASRGYILGGRVEFLPDDNPTSDVIGGAVRFRVYVTPPPPMQEASFILEYDPSYLNTLFS